MPKIFISYRRADAQYVTDTIYSEMKKHFDDDDVFLDIEGIPLGVNFRTYLTEQIAVRDVVLVIIGPDWERIMQDRANQPNDFVRIEVESALSLKKLVIPVLVKGATMPNFANLPESVQELQWLNAAEAHRRGAHMANDCKLIADQIKRHFGQPDISEGQETKSSSKSRSNVYAEAVSAIIGDPFDWCDVPAGEFLYGYNNETHTLPTYKIAKYPVTYNQFQVFVDAKDGYRDNRWWSGFGKGKLDQPPTQNIKTNNHPRTNIRWYDAIAFCRWLSNCLGGDFELDNLDDWLVCLPTDYEWEKAARGTKGLIYPYGNEFDKRMSNTKESRIGRTTSVTQYPQGQSPYGAVDMSGNVWEWCLNNYRNPTINNGFDDNRVKVLRSGSFKHNNFDARASFRGDDLPHFGSRFYGMRLVLSRSIG